MERELRQQGGLLRSIVKAQGLWHPRVNANTSTTFTVDRKRHLLSLASMFGESPLLSYAPLTLVFGFIIQFLLARKMST